MKNVLLVDELDSLTDLSHEYGAGLFRQDEVIVYHTLKELPSLDPETMRESTQLAVRSNHVQASRPARKAQLLSGWPTTRLAG